MGRVWAAHDEVLNRRVAVKEVVLPPDLPRSEADQIAHRTIREARAIASVSDPHVVTVFDMLDLPSGPAIVMELLDARPLSQVLHEDGPLGETRAAKVGAAVAAGLLAAHAAGITHRDVKPGNVLICSDGRIKLTDFGIARSAGEHTITATGLLLGSPAYISPEVAAGRPANAQSDAWGLGALLYACVQGRPPFDRGTALATLTAVVQDPVPHPPSAGRLTGVIRGLLVKDPATRMTIKTALSVLAGLAGDPDGARLTTHHRPAGPDALPQHPAAHRPPLSAPTPFPAHQPPDQTPVRQPTTHQPPALPPPPWVGTAAASLRALPLASQPGASPARGPARRRLLLAAVLVLVTVLATAAGYFGVRALAQLPLGAGGTAGATLPLMSDDPMTDTRARAEQAAAALAKATGVVRHDVALVMGSGWVPAADALGRASAELAVTDLPGFLPPTVLGHSGRVRSVPIGGKRALIFMGRNHFYEGKGVAAVAHGVRTAAAAGARLIVLTNASGGLREGMRPGQPVLISDHLNLTGASPVVGANFVDLTDLYSPRLRELARGIDPELEEGVYAQLPGPHYETPAEIRMLRTMGADLVGMSTVLEAIAAREAGVEVFGVSLVTNLAAGMTGEPLDHKEVLAAGHAAAAQMGALLAQVVEQA